MKISVAYKKACISLQAEMLKYSKYSTILSTHFTVYFITFQGPPQIYTEHHEDSLWEKYFF